ncbi:mobilisation protein [Vallitalea longa]|uniref:Mobilisation protein n=1 Tax=Vallitalea longa TaxID=2936439 RepID=A0A9W5YE55_9FIRM|nr:relaxase/mobilization nuclease domain-containing protein [Vallitalea longa]GKX31394.1 mobilisation protein [Vallitalea longa]
MKRAINYILNPKKTELHLTAGLNCNTTTAYEEFILTKQNYKKETGRQFIHFIQSFSPQDKASPEIIKKIADKLLEHKIFKVFQVVYAVHTDKAHLHTHFIINTVNTDTGRKWQLSKEQLQELKDYSDKLCRQYGLIVVRGKEGNYKNRGEYRSKSKGTSWKYELYLAVEECMKNSTSKEEFISNMEKLGYKVNWDDNRKYITFITPNGKKCRNRKLYPPEKYTKENLLKTFKLNKRYQNKKLLHNRMELLFSAIYILSKSDNTNNQNYPLTYLRNKELKGDALKERIAELQKGRGLNWEIGTEYER